jgi:hypothetical protein
MIDKDCFGESIDNNKGDNIMYISDEDMMSDRFLISRLRIDLNRLMLQVHSLAEKIVKLSESNKVIEERKPADNRFTLELNGYTFAASSLAPECTDFPIMIARYGAITEGSPGGWLNTKEAKKLRDFLILHLGK